MRRTITVLLLSALLALSAFRAVAAAPFGTKQPSPRSMDGAFYGGAVALDGRLGDYRWDVGPLPIVGAELLGRRGRLAAGIRVWRTETSQETGIPGAAISPAVRLDHAALVGEYIFGKVLGVELSVSGSTGLLHVAYSPDRIFLADYEVAGLEDPVSVSLEGTWEWTGGGGIALRRPLAGGILLAAGLERFYFGLDTAHRNGASIVEKRETFANWTGRLGIGWRLGHRQG